MSSTYSTNLAIELIGTGDQAGTWGNTTNTNLGTLIEQAISGYVTQAVSTGTDTTITIPNGATGVARNMYIELTGTGGASTNLIVPANKKLYFIFNNSTGAVTVKVSGQTGVSVPQGKKMVLTSNGTDTVNALNYIADFGSNSATITTLTATSATITNLTLTSLVISNLSIASANITTLTSASATITNLINTSASITTLTNNPTFSAGTANGVLYLNGSKVATSGSALTFDGTYANLTLTSGTTANGFISFSNSADGGTQGYIGDSKALITGGANSSLALRGESNILFGIAATETMRLTSTGLGIGTSSPGAKLQVVGTGQFGGTGTDGAIQFLRASDGGAVASMAFISASTEVKLNNAVSGPMTFFTNNTERMRLDSSGNLGLGVTPQTWYTGGPTIAQQIGANTTIFSLFGTRSVFASNYYLKSGTGADTYIANGYATQYYQESGTHKWFTAPSGTAGNTITFTQAMTLDASGRLIVGGSSATVGNPVEVVSNASGVTLSLRGRSSDASAALTFNANAAATEYARIFSDNNSILAFGTGSSGTERARITSGGEWVVGKTATGLAAAGFEVGTGSAGYVQTVLASSANTVTTWDTYSTGAGAYRFYVGMAGTVFATNTTISAISDQRLKENVRDLDAGLAEVLALKPRKFDWKEGKGQDKKDVRGFIAQEFEQVFPDLIDTWKDPAPEGEEPYKSVRQDLIPVLVKAIQEQQAMINELKAEVAALKGA